MSMPSDPTLYDARLSDGRTAASFAVRVRFAATGLEILVPGESRTTLVWPYSELRSGVPVRPDDPDVLLSLEPNGTQILFVAAPGFNRSLLARASALSPTRQRLMGLRPGIAVVAMVAAIVGAVWVFDFQPAQAVARLLPQPTREAMGRNVVASVAGRLKQCETGPGRAALDRLTQRLVAGASDRPMAVRVVLVDWGLVNAFAAPGGQIILTRGLVQKAGSPDEVAGVLSHELGHVLELHPETGLVRAMGLAAAAQLIFAGSTGTATNIGLLLTQLRYTRVAEREADTHAMRMLKNAGISAKGFGDFFERLEPKRPTAVAKPDEDKKTEEKKKVGLGTRVLTSEILRTHPPTAARLALVRAQPAYPATPALTDADWRALREMCGTVSPAPRPPAPPGSGTASPGPAPRPPTPAPADKAQPADADREIAEASKAVDANPSDVAALQRRARAYSKKGQHSEALADYTKAAQLRPSDANLHAGLGAAHQGLRQYELALAAYDEALRLDTAHIAARNGRGNTNRALKRYEEALGDFDTLIKTRPSYVFAHYNRGLANVDMGRSDDAVRDFTATLGIDKDYAGAYANRGLLHEKAGARDKAIADFRAALAAPPGKYDSGPWAHRTARERLKAVGEVAP